MPRSNTVADGLLAWLLHHAAHAAARRWSSRQWSVAELQAAEAMKQCGCRWPAVALLYSSAPCWVVRRACRSEGGTPLSRQSAGLPALLLQYAAHAAARRWSRKLRSEAELHTARGGEAMRLADGLLLKTKAFLYSSALFFPY